MWHVTWAYWLSTGLVAADNFTLWCNSESFVTNAKVTVRSPIQGIPSHRMRGRKQISSHIFAQCGSKAQKLVAKKPECNRVHNSKYESCQKVSCWFGSYTQRIYETTWAAAASKSRERDSKRDSKRIQQAYTASIYSKHIQHISWQDTGLSFMLSTPSDPVITPCCSSNQTNFQLIYEVGHGLPDNT